jgi:hypothetical protein
VGFRGRCGAGQSTLAAALRRPGSRLVGDDICAVTSAPEAVPVVPPGYPQVKLWADILEQYGLPAEALQRIQPLMDRHAWPTAEAFCPEALPLRRLYGLQPTNTAELTLQALSGPVKLWTLQHHTYRAPCLDGLEGWMPYVKAYAAIATRVPIGRRVRPQEPCLLESMATLLEQDWAW